MQRSAGIAHLILLTLALSSRPAAALPACPAAGMSQPPGKALSFKNAAQDLRDREEWAKAAQSFRHAADELPTCEDFDDERLRWSLWAVEAHEKSGDTGAQQAMSDFVARQLAALEDHPSGRALPDLPQLQAARDRLQPSPLQRPAPTAAPPPDTSPDHPHARSSRAPLVLLGVGGAVLALSVALLVPFSLRNKDLDRQLNGEGGIYDQMAAMGCGITPAADEIPGNLNNCNYLRDDREELLAHGQVANAIVIGTAVTASLGGIAAITGLGLHLRQRRAARETAKTTLTLGPTLNGVFVRGRF